jgi:hypothetical protein
MDNSNFIITKKAIELNSLAGEFTLSHAVLATARMIEEQKRSFQSSDDSIKDDVLLCSSIEDYEKINEKRLMDEMTNNKVYISVSDLPDDKHRVSGARTFYYERVVPSETNLAGTSKSKSEHFEIILPPKENEGDCPVSYENGKISKKSRRFLIGHELGHLWLHLDEVRKLINNLEGTQFLSQDKNLESDATIFSNKISELRDDHILEIADLIKRNRR